MIKAMIPIIVSTEGSCIDSRRTLKQ